MKYTWLVERIPAIQIIKQCLGVGYGDAVLKYNEIIEFLDSAKDIEKKGHDTLEFTIFGLRTEKVLDFETKSELESKLEEQEDKEDLVNYAEAESWFEKQSDFDKEMINRLIKMNQYHPARG